MWIWIIFLVFVFYLFYDERFSGTGPEIWSPELELDQGVNPFVPTATEPWLVTS